MLSIHKTKKAIAMCIIAMLFISNVAMLANEEVKAETKSGYTSHSPIYINGNSDFTSENGVSSGDGSQGNPYIIEDWDIDASSQNGIEIRNTDAYFVIRNCYVHDAWSDYAGIYFNNVKNGKIENSEMEDNWYGVEIGSSNNNQIINNTAYSNSIGILIGNSNNNQIINNTAYGGNGGIYLSSSNNNQIKSNTAYSNNYDGIYLYDSSCNNTITSNTAYDNNYRGIECYDSSNDNQITNNAVYSNNYGFYLWISNNNIVYLNNITGNTNQAYDDSTNNWDYNGKGNYWDDYSGTDGNGDGIGDTPYVIDSDSQDNYPLMQPYTNKISHSPIYINGNSQFTAGNGVSSGNGSQGNPYIIENWDIDASSDDGIDIRNTDKYFVIRNCYVHDSGSSYKAIYFYNVQNGKLENSLLKDNNYHVIWIESSNGNTINNNTISDTYNGNGIYLDDSSSNNIITNNNIYNFSSGTQGIDIRWSSNNNIIANNKVHDGYNGIYLGYSSNGNTITNNNVYSNTNYGILNGDSDNTIIINNNVANNGNGIRLSSSSNAQIYLNNIINNTNQAGDDGTNNWDNGTVGNYWSDYTGTDSNSDGIGDTPYVIDSDSQDNYPLMNPVNNYTINKKPTAIIDSISPNPAIEESSVNFAGHGTDNDGNIIAYEWYSSIDGLLSNSASFSSSSLSIGVHSISFRVKDNNNTWSDYVFASLTINPINQNQTHEPIYINGNENFTYGNGVSSGDGSQGNPYIIEGWDINASGQNGIEIRNTTAYFVIKNCYVHDGYYDGIYFYNVKNGKIENSEVKNNRIGIYFYSSNNNQIINNAVYDNQYGISLDSSNNNSITNNSVHDNYYGIELEYSNNNQIKNNSVYDNNYYCIYFTSSNNNQIKNNSIYNNNYYCIYFTSSSNNQIANNFVYGNTGGSISFGLLLGSDSCDNNQITNNSIYDNTGGGICLVNANNNSITSNILHDNEYGISLGGLSISDSCNNNQIKNNSIYNNTDDGIRLQYSSNNQIKNNSIYNNTDDGIYLFTSNNNTITNNTAHDNEYGISIFSGVFSNNTIASNNNQITDNTVYDNYYGIALSYSSNNNQIADNTVYDNYYGIYLYFNSNNNTIIINTIYGNDYGIYLEDFSSYNEITNNAIHNNEYGIYLHDYSSNNKIYLNNITDNTNQAWDNNYNNWDYNGKGNYWSDYTGTDSNSDGIGDTPYSISGGNNKDNYPLMVSSQISNVVTLYSSDITKNSIKLTWTKYKYGNFKNYTILISEDNKTWNFLTSISDINTVSYKATNLKSNKIYYFKILVYDNDNLYSESNIISIKTQSETTEQPKNEFPILYVVIGVIVISIIIVGISLFFLKRKPKQPQYYPQPQQDYQQMQQPYPQYPQQQYQPQQQNIPTLYPYKQIQIQQIQQIPIQTPIAKSYCPFCNREIEQTWELCQFCGNKLQLRCLKCNSQINEGEMVCPNCGEKI